MKITWSLGSHCVICDYTNTASSLEAIYNTSEASNILGKCSVREGEESFKLWFNVQRRGLSLLKANRRKRLINSF